MCYNLSSVIIPEKVTVIGECAFYDCYNLESVIIRNSKAVIGECAFYSCSNLTNVDLGNNITSIDNGAFERCGELTSITIPDSVTCLGDSVFYKCERLNTVKMSDNISSIGNALFGNCSNISNIIIPDGVTSIGDNAFSWCINLKNIVIPDSVINIGEYAFYRCYKLADVEFSKNVESIGTGAFSLCDSITTIMLPNSVKTIGGSAFYQCTNLTSITIGSKVKSIENNTFNWCINLTSIQIPKTVTSIRYDAFFYCDKLTDIYYTGTESEWNAIEIEDDNIPLSKANIHFNCSDGSDKNEDELTFENGINVFAASGSMSINQGEVTRFAVCVYENGERKKDLSKLAYINETPEIFSVSRDYDIEDGYCYISVNAKECGVGFLQINDTSTGETVRVIISVIHPKANSYTIYNFPEMENHGEHTPNILYFNGMSIDDFKFNKQNDGSSIVSFNVFNTLPVYAIVTVFDSNGIAISNHLIDNHEQYSESVYSGLVEEPIKLINDIASGDLMSYRQTAGYSSETNVSVLIPHGGYIKITNNPNQSEILKLIDFIDVFVKFKSLITGGVDFADWSAVSYDCLRKAAEDILRKSESEHIEAFKSNVFMDCLKKVDFSNQGLLECASIFSDCIETLSSDILEIIVENALEVGVNVTEEWFVAFAGVAGAVLKGAFLYNTYWNVYEKMYYLRLTTNVGAISVRNPNETLNIMTYDDVTVVNSKGFDSETSLETFRLTIDEGLSEDLKNSVLNSPIIKELSESSGIETSVYFEKAPYQLYDITFVKNGKEHQPGENVTVYLPVPDEMKKHANWMTKLKVYRVEEDGSLTKMDSKYSGSNDMVSFTTNHFSLYLVLVEAIKPITIYNPSHTDIPYGDSVILHLDANMALPNGYRVVWTASNANFDYSVSADGTTCIITPSKSGDTTFTATVYDAEGNEVCKDEQTMTSKAGFFQKLAAFFKKIFGLTKTYPEAFKGTY